MQAAEAGRRRPGTCLRSRPAHITCAWSRTAASRGREGPPATPAGPWRRAVPRCRARAASRRPGSDRRRASLQMPSRSARRRLGHRGRAAPRRLVPRVRGSERSPTSPASDMTITRLLAEDHAGGLARFERRPHHRHRTRRGIRFAASKARDGQAVPDRCRSSRFRRRVETAFGGRARTG